MKAEEHIEKIDEKILAKFQEINYLWHERELIRKYGIIMIWE